MSTNDEKKKSPVRGLGKWSAGIIATAFAGLVGAWLTGFLSTDALAPARVQLALENLWRGDPPPPEERFRIVLSWLEDDTSGKDTKSVATALRNVGGIELMRSACIVEAPGARDKWLPAMQQSARAVLEDWHADLAIVGEVKESQRSLNLWLVPRSGDGTLGRGDQPYLLKNVTLGEDFRDDLQAQLTATALAAVAPLADNEVRGRVLGQGLRDATTKLSRLLENPTISSREHLASLYLAQGIALSTLGEREGGSERLEDAVVAYRAALEGFTRERVPLDWAATQNNLGIALSALGRRERGTARLEEATTAYRAALEERTPGRFPFEWAMTQHNLGTALETLGQRENGTGRLEEAVAAYRAALEERTRDRVPLDWAATQNNLGTALTNLGQRESGTERLEKAVAAYRAALEERTRKRVPLDWAMTQNNLGAALRILGQRESGTGRLEEAEAAHRAAVGEYTRERVPLEWAGTQNNLGVALAILGRRERDTARLKQAAAAFRAALGEYTHERAPHDWAMTQFNLGNVLWILGAREDVAARLEEAVESYREALKGFTAEGSPRNHDLVQNHLKHVLDLLHARRAEPGSAAESN